MIAQQNERRIYDAASQAEGSDDPILVDLEQQNAMLQAKLDVYEKQDHKEKETCNDQNRKLQAEAEKNFLKRRKKESNVEKMTEFMNDSFSCSENVQSMSAIQSDHMSLNAEEVPTGKTSTKLDVFQNQVPELTQQYNSLQSTVDVTESKYIESRLDTTTGETEVELVKQKREQDQICKIMTYKSKLEEEFYQINDKHEEALNSINDLEEANRKIQL